jgi:hypothetical protein
LIWIIGRLCRSNQLFLSQKPNPQRNARAADFVPQFCVALGESACFA